MVSECEIPPARFLSEKPDPALARPGVYAIFCDVSGKYYVGSSNNIRSRINGHRNSFARNQHCNAHLKRAHSKYGIRSFLFVALEFTESDVNDLISCERKWIDSLDSVKSGFNIMPAANSPLGCKRTDENRENLKKAFANRGSVTHRRYKFISPDGQVFAGKNVAKFCRTIGMNANDGVNMSALARGKLCTFKGWRSENSPQKKKPRPRGRSYDLVSPEGERFTGSNLRAFAISINMRPAYFADLISGKTNKTIDGWSRHSAFAISTFKRKTNTLISPEGVKIEFNHIANFCRAHSLNAHSVQAFLSSNQKSYLGWSKSPCS